MKKLLLALAIVLLSARTLTFAGPSISGSGGGISTSSLGVDPGDTLQAPADPGAHTLFGFDNTDNTYKPILIGSNLSFDQPTSTLSALGSTDPDDLTGDTVDDNKVDNAIVAPPAVQSVTCTDAGGGNYSATITPTAGIGRVDIRVTNPNADVCELTLAETGAVSGTEITITNVSAANTLSIATSADVQTLKRGSPHVITSNDLIRFIYTGTLWLEEGRSGSELLTILDDAAQFANAADTSKKVKIDPSNQGAGQTGTIQAPVNGTATLVAGTQAGLAAVNVFTAANTIGDGGDDIKIKFQKNTGDGTWNGLTMNLTAHENVAFGQLVFINSDGEAALADADAAATMPVVAIVVVAANADATCTVLTHGVVSETDWNWTAGQILYGHETAGSIENTVGNITDTNDVVQRIGVALGADTILFMPSLDMIVLE